ncbi:putative CoA-transferase [compost metagenome]
MYLALGVVSAILQSRLSGIGQVVDAAIVDGAASLMTTFFGRLAAGQWRDERGVNMLDGGLPWYDTYRTADAKYVAIGALEPQFFAVLCEKLGLDAHWLEARNNHALWPALRAELEHVIGSRTRDHWCALLEGTDACFSPVLSMQEAPLHPHNVAREAFVERDGVTQPAPAPRVLSWQQPS